MVWVGQLLRHSLQLHSKRPNRFRHLVFWRTATRINQSSMSLYLTLFILGSESVQSPEPLPGLFAHNDLSLLFIKCLQKCLSTYHSHNLHPSNIALTHLLSPVSNRNVSFFGSPTVLLLRGIRRRLLFQKRGQFCDVACKRQWASNQLRAQQPDNWQMDFHCIRQWARNGTYSIPHSRWMNPFQNNLEAIIFTRANDVITTSTGYTPKKKKVVIDEVPYVTVKSVNLSGDQLKVSVTRPLGPVGPRGFSLDKCVNWLVLPGGSMKGEHFKKHHGGVSTIKVSLKLFLPQGSHKETIIWNLGTCTLRSFLITSKPVSFPSFLSHCKHVFFCLICYAFL